MRPRVVVALAIAAVTGIGGGLVLRAGLEETPRSNEEETQSNEAEAFLDRALEGRSQDIRTADAEVRSARRSIHHIVFIIKENRTFDTYFGRFPGADGATSGLTCDGERIPLTRAEDDSMGPVHSFDQALKAMNGGRMNCFDLLIIISPWARPGAIESRTLEFSSVLKFIETVFDLPPFASRDARASNMLDVFDFDQEPVEPLILEERVR